jgi:SNF2 family DNA or RNA helicase
VPPVLRREGDVLELDLSNARGFEFQDALDKIKAVVGRRYDGTRKIWSVPAEAAKAEQIINLISPEVDEDIRKWVVESKMKAEADLLTPLPDDADVLVPWGFERCAWQPEKVNDETFTGLLDYQRAAVEHIAQHRQIILADDMGLGKTLEMISALTEALLRCSYEAERLVSMGTEESRRASEALSSLLSTVPGENLSSHFGGEDGALYRLWHQLAAGDHGPGSRTRREAIRRGPVDEGQGTQRVSVTNGGRAGRDCEVRASLSELPSLEALALGPKLIVSPASVMGSWERELRRWLGADPGIQLVDGYNLKKRHQQITDGILNNAWVIVNWEQLSVERIGYKVRHRGGATSTKFTWVMKEPLLEIPHVAWMRPTLDDLDYKLVRAARKQPEAHGWLAVFADEAHKAKNPRAKRSKGLHRIPGWMRIAATGTPIMNSPDEIWSLLHWLWPEQYTSFESFYGEYVDYYENEHLGGKVVTGVKNPDALRFELKGRLVRRTQGQVRDSLPGRRRIYFPVDLLPEQQKLYDDAEQAIWLEVTQAAAEGDEAAQKLKQALTTGATPASLYRIPNGAARLVRLRQIIETPATLGGEPDSAVIEDLIEKVEDSEPEPWLVFTEFVPTSHVIADKLSTKFGFARWSRDTRDSKKPLVAVYTGDTPKDERTMIEDDFQSGKVRAIVGTIKALQVGITLTAGHLQYWVSRDFVPDINEQGEARQADRLGQARTTMIYVPEAAGTVAETKVPIILGRKEAIVRTVVSKDKIEEVHK